MSTIDPSGIDPLVPAAGASYTANVRANFAEIVAQFNNAIADIDGLTTGETIHTNFRSTGIDDNATTIQLALLDDNAIFGGNVSLVDDKYLYLGAGNSLFLKHSGVDGTVGNEVGNLIIANIETSGIIGLYTNNSVDALKSNIIMGGAIPNCQFYGDGALSFSTKASSTYKTINFASIPTSTTGLSAGDVWSNGGVLTIV